LITRYQPNTARTGKHDKFPITLEVKAMKRIILTIAALMILSVFLNSLLFAQKPPLPNTPAPEEMAKRNQAIQNAKTYLDKMVGKWSAEYMQDAKKVKTLASFERVVNNQFIKASIQTYNEKNERIFESLVIMSFNAGGMQYLINSFEASGWTKTYLGKYSADQVQVQGVTPDGIEHIRWKFTTDGKLEFAHWAPVQGEAEVHGDPDTRILFSQVK
jgi:hypothetical protein